MALVAVVASAVTIIGADALWMPALGNRIRQSSSIPDGIPFAAAPSAGWVNTTAGGQLVLSVAQQAGSIGLVAANLLAVVCSMALLAANARRRGARPAAIALVIATVAVGGATSLFIARAQMLSLVPFALLLVLLRRQEDRPTLAIWWVVPLLALWSNLHGAVLVGAAVVACHVLFSRLRRTPVTAVAVGVAALGATCLNPGLLRAPHYYVGVLSGQATTDGSGMWGRLSLSNPFDVVLVLAAVGLGAFAIRRRHALWEYAAALGMLLATLSAARHGVWLLLFLAVPAALASRPDPVIDLPSQRGSSLVTATIAIVGVVLCTTVLVMRLAAFKQADGDAARMAVLTRGQVVLTAEPFAESLAAAGATVWASNPLDAFSERDQAAYLAFNNGDASGARQALQGAQVVVAVPHSAQARAALLSGYSVTETSGGYVLMRRP